MFPNVNKALYIN